MHFCPDEIRVIAGLLGSVASVGLACRYCWMRLTAWRRKP